MAMPCTMSVLQEGIQNERNDELTRSEVIEMMTPIHGRRAQTDVEALQDIQRTLQDGDIQEPLVLYPRQSDITEWYYQIFYTTKENDKRGRNQILCMLFPDNREIKGEAAIVANGARFDPKSDKWDIDSIELGKTLWWYMKGGQNARKVANQRRFISYLENM